MRKAILGVATATVLAVVAFIAGCTSKGQSATAADQQAIGTQLSRYQQYQPVPAFDRSQYRQTIIDVESAQVHGVATTTFFFNMGVTKPIKSCPSIGYPVASTAQLTNPEQMVGNSAGNTTIGQLEPNGVYTGDSSGTYVICVAPNGTKYVTYWEGFVQTEGGAAHWDNAQAMIILDGPPTVVANDPKCQETKSCK